ncbi:MAG TPA: DUF72 domain-containing protein [bacterium]|nr:DUF72 domain-containing protein [bacterium]
MDNHKNIFIGTSGWSYDHWVGKFYPQDLKKNQWIKYLAENFNSVELNMSFYRFPFPNIIKGWYNKLPENFQMTLKANRNITHRKRFKDTDELVEKFYHRADILKDKLGCILFQTPPSFKNTEQNFQRLQNFLESRKPNYRNVFEFRHKSWWNDQAYDLLDKNGAGFCTVSGLGMPKQVQVTSEIAYFRFHGPGKAYESRYTEESIQEWAAKIKKVSKQESVKSIYCYFNNDMNGYAVENARELQAALAN